MAGSGECLRPLQCARRVIQPSLRALRQIGVIMAPLNQVVRLHAVVDNFTPRRFRVEVSVAFAVVALIAMAHLQYQRNQPFDAAVALFSSAYVAMALLLGYRLASWYIGADPGWFELLAVPLLITLLSALGACLAFIALDFFASRTSDAYAVFGGAMLLVVVVLKVASPVSMVVGLAASVLLRAQVRRR